MSSVDYDIGYAIRKLHLIPRYRKDCYFYEEEQDMNAHFSICKYSMLACNCDGCKKYINNKDVLDAMRRYVDGLIESEI